MHGTRYIHKIALLMICVAFSQQVFSNELLKCLGKEEWFIHKKKLSGPLYKLNQTFTNEVAGSNSLVVKKKYLKKICNPIDNSSSVTFLKLALLHGLDIYKSSSSEDEKLKALRKSNLQNFNDKIPLVFFDYLSQLQSLTDYPHCMKENIPELNYYLERYKHLQNEFSASKLMNDKSKIIAIFEKLNHFDKYLKKCNRQQKKISK